IAGFLRVPAGAPADESLRVLAVSEALSPAVVYGKDGLLEHVAKGKKEKLIASAPVAPDGRFSLALGTSAELWLVVDGRFLYSEQPTRVAAGESSVEVTPKLGSALSGTIHLPAGATPAAGEFADLDLDLGPDGGNFSIGGGQVQIHRSATVDEGGRF